MFIGLLALQSGHSCIRVCSGSHRSNKAEAVQLIQLDRYEYIICHPKLIHGGCSAAEYNLRLHFYHGLPKSAAMETDLDCEVTVESRADRCSKVRAAYLEKKALKRLAIGFAREKNISS
jgi:hypothetical protein